MMRKRADKGRETMIEFRKAVEEDAAAIISFDHVAQVDEQRRDFIRDSVLKGAAWVAAMEDRVAG